MTILTPEMSDIGAMLGRIAAADPDRACLAFTQEGEWLSYGRFDERVNRTAHGLAALGVSRGDFVNLMLPNGPTYMAVAYALRRLGAVEVAINCEVRGPGLARMLNLADTSVLVLDEEFAEQLAAVAADVRAPKTVITSGRSEDWLRRAWPTTRFVPIGEVSVGRSADPPDVKIHPLDPAVVLFTSGTTGPSKGCLIGHRALIRSAESIPPAVGLTRDDRVFTAYPLFHGRASTLDVLAAIRVGGSAVIAPKFSASRIWDQMREFEATTFSLIGTVMQILWKQTPSPRDKDHKVRITWGGPITVAPAMFEERFGVRVLPGEGVYGMTETAVVSMSAFDPETSGKVRPIYSVRIADDDDAAVPPGEVGEILVRSEEPGVLYSEYLAMPEATVAASRNLWFHTGDLGRLDSENRLTFVGRKGERIRRGGHNISAWEVEEAIDAHPDVLENAVIGVPSPFGEQDIKAFVVLRPGAGLDEAGLLDHCRAQLARFMVPQLVEFLDEMPKTQSGKPAKGTLLQRHQADTAS